MLVLILLLAAQVGQQALPVIDAFDRHMRLGQYYLDGKDSGRAASEFEAATRLDLRSAAARYSLGVALRLWGDPQGAERALREALRLQPRFPEAHFVLGLVLGDRVGSESLGLAEFEAAVAQNPSFGDAHFNIGVIHWKQNEAGRAVAAFRKATAARPNVPEYHFRLGQALARAGHLKEAVGELQRAVELDPDHKPAQYQLSATYSELGEEGKAAAATDALRRARARADSLARDQAGLQYRQGMSALERGQLDEAIEYFQRALKAPFDEARFRMALGIAWQRKGNLAAAGAEFRKALELNPGSVDAHLNYGVLLVRMGDAAGAEREFRDAIRADPNFADAHFNLGLAMAAQRRWKEAADSLQNAIRLNPNPARFHWNLGRVLRDSGDLPGAVAAYARAWSLDRTLTQAALEYGRLLPREKAREIWRQALERDPLNAQLQEAYLSALDDPAPARRRFALLNGEEYRKAVSDLNRGALEPAIRQFQAILHQHAELAEVRRSLAVALFANKRYGEAAREYENLVSANPSDSELRISFGAALREAGSLDRARQELEEASRMNPDSARAHYQLGLLFSAQSDETRAMAHFHAARRLDPALSPPKVEP
jgi:tetratricopeptide (TPR) repeat protein